ncbi:exonuclease [Gordonia phage Suzy]|uniref:Exonuclease n=1 Tax=Gordonia phage Suzy TaxID=2201430 RepID=A0A2Z4Q8P9_9CAUD|nr:exonuclease [Gordonia phage Suzy]AWY06159.1 exonuclease [Gordonia phage Suzy]
MTELPFVRSSERGAYKSCPQRWYWAYVEKLVPSAVVLGARDFGTGLHLAMAEFYIPGLKRGRDLIETFDEWARQAKNEATATEKGRKNFNEAEFNEECEKIRHALREHMRITNGNPHWEVIANERTFAADIRGKAIAVGTIDLVIRDTKTGKLWIIDWKTSKGFPHPEAYKFNDQGGSYSAIATTILRHLGLIGPQEKIKGMVFVVLRKVLPDERPQNPDGLYCNQPKKDHYIDQLGKELEYEPGELEKMTLKQLQAEALENEVVVYGDVSKNQPMPVIKDYPVERTVKQQSHQLKRLVDDVTVMDMARKGEIPILKAPGSLCPYCDFFQLCEMDESQGDVEGMKQLMFRKRDPYHDHREGAQNSKLSVTADSKLKYEGGT